MFGLPGGAEVGGHRPATHIVPGAHPSRINDETLRGTVRAMAEAGLRALVVEAGRTLLLDAAGLAAAARDAGITVVGWSGRGVG